MNATATILPSISGEAILGPSMVAAETGRDRSRLNAVRHGLAGVGGVVAGEDPALEARYRAWAAEIAPGTEEGRFALRQAVAETFRVESCRSALAAAERLASTKASTEAGWEIERRAAAAKLAEGLARRPEATRRRLETTRQGAEILLTRWQGLDAALEAGREWDEAEVAIALDLLGVPLHLRESGSPLSPWREIPVAQHRRDVVRIESERLTRLIAETLTPIDELERLQAAAGVSFLSSREAGLILRYERDALRRHGEFLAIARASRTEAEASGGVDTGEICVNKFRTQDGRPLREIDRMLEVGPVRSPIGTVPHQVKPIDGGANPPNGCRSS